MLRKIATMEMLEAYRVPKHADAAALHKAAHRVSFDYRPRPGFLYVRSRAISSRCNDNYDEFPADEIAKAYRTFIGKPVFVNHHNENHKRMRGVVIDAALHRDTNPDGSPDVWAEVLMEVDAKTFPKLAKAILEGEVDRTSMGCDVQLSVCSACGNKATNPAEYCQHIPAMKGQRIFRVNAKTGRREGHLVREICYGLGFFENSLLVEEPADPTAYFLGVDDRGLKTAANKTAVAEDVEPHGDAGCPNCGSRDFTQHFRSSGMASCENCGEVFDVSKSMHQNITNQQAAQMGRDQYVRDREGGDELFKRLTPHRTKPIVDWGEDAEALKQRELPERADRDLMTGLPLSTDTEMGRKLFDRRKERALTHSKPMRLTEGPMDPRHLSKRAVSDEEIWKGLGLPKAEDTHGEVNKMRGEDLGRALMKPFYDQYGGEENYHLHRNNESMMDLHRRYEGGSGKFGFDDEDEGGEPYYEIHHQSPQGKKTGWSVRHYSDGPNAEIRHDATPGEAHDVFDIGENTYGADSPGLGGHIQPPETFGHNDLKRVLDDWHGDEESGAREHLEGPYGDPRIRRWKRRHGSLETEGAAGPKYPNPADHPFFQTNPSNPDNIVSSWHRADDGKKAQGMRWYSDAHEVAKAIAGGDAAKGAGVLAAYSPKAAWPSNMFNAARSLKEGRALGKGEGDSIMGQHQRLAQQIIEGKHHSEVFKSPKISDFAHLIEHGGDEEPDKHTRVVVDRHAMSVATGKRMTTADLEDAPLGSRHYYEHVADDFRQAAATISEHEGHPVAPHQVQAVTWLVQQHENVAHDLSQGGPGGKGRQTRDRNMWHRWQEHGPTYVPEPGSGNIHLVSPHQHHNADAPGKTAGLDDVVAPPEVDTLRDEECPVCGETDVYDGERCPVCGFVAPPEMFRDPDLDMAKQIDLRQTQDPAQAPGQPNPDEPGGGLIDPSQLGESPTADQLQHPDQLNPNGVPTEPGTPADGVADLFCPACGEGFDAGQPMSSDQDPNTVDTTGPAEGMPCPNCGQATLLSPADMEEMGEQPVAPGAEGTPEAAGAPQEDEVPPDGTELPPGEEAPAEDDTGAPGTSGDDQAQDEDQDEDQPNASPVDDEERPPKGRKDKNPRGARRMSKSVEAALAANTAAVGDLMRELRVIGAQNDLLAKVAGLEEQFAAIRRQADVNNPASPVPDPGEEAAPESTEQAVTPEAMDDPTRPGQTPNAVQGVPAEQSDTPLRPGVTMPTSPANQLIDVTAPVAGTNTGEVPLEQRRIETDVRVGDPMAGAGSPQATAFPWTMSSKGGPAAANRTMAALRLAELRVAAGIANGDRYALAAGLETDANLSDDSMATEIRTLEAVASKTVRQPRPAGLVPRAASGQNGEGRTAPSLAPQLASMGAGAGYDDTADSDLFM